MQQSKPLESSDTLRRLLALQEEIHGPDSQETLITLQNLATELYKLGKVTEALPLAKRALLKKAHSIPQTPHQALAYLQTVSVECWT